MYPDIFESTTFPLPIQKFPQSTCYQICYRFSTLESRFKNIQIHQMHVGESRIQKEKVLDPKTYRYGYLWTGP